MKQYDAIIIGFGKGGKTLAADLAKRNRKVAMIERSDKMYGGTCPNIGCIPTKFLIHEAKISRYKELDTFIEKASAYREAIRNKNKLTAQLCQNNYNRLADNPNITIYNGEGSFLSADTVSVKMGKETIDIKGKEIFIDTGAVPVMPNISGLEESENIYNSTTIMELEELPKHLLIIGGGYIGLEFASMYANFGSKVTVIESYPHLIPKEDRDVAYSVKEALEKKGVTFKINIKIQSVYNSSDGVTITYTDNKDGLPYFIEADAVLVATGRRACTQNLNLEAAGVKTDERGNIIVDEHLKTNMPHIWALGDVKGGLQFTYISLDDYRIIRDELFGNHKRTANRELIAYSVFIDPPLSRIGMSEEEALKEGMEIKVAKMPATSNQRIKTLGETEGLLKAIVDAKTNKILGCTLFCADSSEVINTIAMAMRTGQDYTYMRDFIYTHPSVSEALNDLFEEIE